MLTALSHQESAAEHSISAVRREMGSKGLLAFVRTYLSHYFKKPASRMHTEIAAELERMTGFRGSGGAGGPGGPRAGPASVGAGSRWPPRAGTPRTPSSRSGTCCGAWCTALSRSS